ncbi:MAG: FadR family transcriptional regulator [Deltaproteobacteria bacterium]|nr:FadR family transcriptional regulator [Deltaproteobacteria bacterium]
MMKPLARTSAVDACAAGLEAAILDGTFAPGDRLPPERTLADTLGVNRTTLRSALTRLAAAGLVVPRQGDGCIVRDFRETGGLELVAALLGRARTRADRLAIARDLLAVRRAIASVVLERLVAKPPARSARQVVSEASRAFEAAVLRGADARELAKLDLDVLTTLVDASGSPVVRLLMNPVGRLLADFDELTRVLYGAPQRNVLAHAAVLAWLDSPSDVGAQAMLATMAQSDREALAPPARRRAKSPRRAPRR